MGERRKRARKSHADLARLVLDMVRERGMRPGAHLSEQVFAESCAVSRTPIRAAFKMLSENGFLTARPGGGYALAIDADAPGALATARLDTQEDALAEMILADRAARRLDDAPSVSFLARRYSVSRVAVLNALKILQAEGIIDRLPGQSWCFRPILDTPRALADSHQFRLALEPQAILTPGFALDPRRALVLRRQMQEMRAAGEGRIAAAAFARLDAEFHGLIARGAANAFMRDALLAHHRLRLITERDSGVPEFRLRQSLQEHLDILDSLERYQFDIAADQMALHLRLSRNPRPDAANRGGPPLLRLPGAALRAGRP